MASAAKVLLTAIKVTSAASRPTNARSGGDAGADRRQRGMT